MSSEIDWTLDRYTLRKKLLILSTKKLKQLCKTRNVPYSEDKSETVASLINSKDANSNQSTHIRTPTPTIMYNAFEEKKAQVVVKVGMLGDSQVGMRSLMVKYVDDKYDEDYIETLGVNFMEKTFNLKHVDVTISIWIPSAGGGLHSWSSWMSLVCSDAKVIIFVFDLTNKMSLLSVKRYYKEARRENKCFMPFLVGTKYDLYEENGKEFNFDITRQARKFASKMHSPLIYCSSLAGINVKKIFRLIIAKVFDLKPRMKEVHSIDDAIFEWTKDGTKEMGKEMICIVYGYIRQVKNLYKWKYEMPIEDFANIVLLFYVNVVIGGNNKEYKLESRTHQKVERKNRKEERKRKKKLKNDKQIETVENK